MSLLELDDIHLRFSGIVAVDRVSLALGEGETLAVVGPNGSGKTSLLDCASGFRVPSAGTALFAGEPVRGPEVAARRGLARTFQTPRLVPSLDVLDNVLLGIEGRERRRLVRALAGRRATAWDDRTRAEAVLERLGLADWRRRRIHECPAGVRRRIELARALASRPRLLLLDEPAAGLAAAEKRALEPLLVELRDRDGLAILLVEHDLDLAGRVAARMALLVRGNVVALGPPEAVSRRAREGD
jgi:branched-chain amino acid transport system ATP-binding protein